MTSLTIDKPVNAEASPPNEGLTVVDFILRQLEGWGVERIYGVIGDAIFELLDGLARTDKLQYIPCRHEEAAALMASAEAKLTGRLAVCIATSGPGMANLLNGLADAAMDRAPVLAITGQVETSKLGTFAKQYIDQQKLISPIAEGSRLVAHPDALPELMLRCMTESLTQGAVTHLSLPKNIYRLRVTGAPVPYPPHLHQTLYTPLENIRETAELLRDAERPVLYIGRGAASCPDQVFQLADRLDAAVVTTLPARAIFPNGDPRYAGGLGQAGSEASSVLLAESDLILTLGATWWPQDYVPSRVPIVQIDRVPQQIGMKHPVRLGVVGDLALLLPQLLELLGAQPDRSGWHRRVDAVNRAWKQRIEAEAGADGTPLPPQRVMKAIADRSAEDAVIAVDTGDHTLWFDRIFTARQQDILISGRWRTLGFALPAAIAAKLAQPQRQVIGIAGDGGAVQTLLELQTAAQLGAAVTLVVIDNGCYAMEKNRMLAGGLQPLGSELVNPDFCKIAEACGCAAWQAETAQQLEEALSAAFGQEKPALIRVRTAPSVVPHTN